MKIHIQKKSTLKLTIEIVNKKFHVNQQEIYQKLGFSVIIENQLNIIEVILET